MPIPAHMTIEAEKQGKIEGACKIQGREGTILVQEFKHDVHIPVDPQTGAPRGPRVHGAMKIVKEFDKASPLLYQALCSGEHLKSVEIQWYRNAKDGTQEHYFTTALEDAVIVRIEPSMPNCLDKALGHFGHMEEVSFIYRKAMWRHEVDKTEAEDDWDVQK